MDVLSRDVFCEILLPYIHPVERMSAIRARHDTHMCIKRANHWRNMYNHVMKQLLFFSIGCGVLINKNDHLCWYICKDNLQKTNSMSTFNTNTLEESWKIFEPWRPFEITQTHESIY